MDAGARHPRSAGFDAIGSRLCLRIVAAFCSEHGVQLLVGDAINQLCLDDHNARALGLELAAKPLQILERLLGARQRVDRLLDRYGAEAAQAAPRFDAQIVRFGRQLMNEEQPAPPRRLPPGCFYSIIH